MITIAKKGGGAEFIKVPVTDESGAGVTELTLPKAFMVFDNVKIKQGGTAVYTDKSAIEAAAKHIPADNPLFDVKKSDEEGVNLVIFCTDVWYTEHKNPVVTFERRGTLSGERDRLRERTQRITTVRAMKDGILSTD